MFFNRRELITVHSMREQAHIQEALAARGIPCFVKMLGTARAMERRARLGGNPDRDLSYGIYVRRGDYEEAAHLLQSLRRGG